MQDKVKLGNRYMCYQCGCKFYDLNRHSPTCPECSADQREAPVRDIKSILKSGRRRPATDSKAPPPTPKSMPDDDDSDDDNDNDDLGDDDDDDDALGLLGDDDDDDDGDGDDDDDLD